MNEDKKSTLPKIRNIKTAEIESYDLEQAQNESVDKFRKDYRDFYNDLKNTRETEDW